MSDGEVLEIALQQRIKTLEQEAREHLQELAYAEYGNIEATKWIAQLEAEVAHAQWLLTRWLNVSAALRLDTVPDLVDATQHYVQGDMMTATEGGDA